MPKKLPRGSRARGHRNIQSHPLPSVRVAHNQEGGSGRENAATGKASRRPIVSEALQVHLFLLFAGAVMLCLGVWGGWLAVVSLLRGWFDEGEGVIVYANQEPVWFYVLSIMFSALAAGSIYIGAQMIWYARDESRLSARWPSLPTKGRRGSR